MQKMHFVVLILALFMPSFGLSKSEITAYSFQLKAHAPNAGGQTAYSLRRATDQHEWSVFGNTYLQAAGFPLVGISYNLRFPVCDSKCFWQFYVQVGGGVCSAGPMAEILWGTTLFWILRVDFATHLYVTQSRMIFWSYPLWVGLSIPIF